MLDCVEIDPDSKPSAVVIWLHGLGADGHDFEPIVHELNIPESTPVRYVFPHAPVRPVTVNGGMRMRAWFDIVDIQIDRKIDFEGFFESVRDLEVLIERELDRGITSNRLILAGFSQGGAVALHTGLRYPKPLAGIIALSTYLPTSVSTADEASQENKSTPIFLAHGRMDPVVPVGLGTDIDNRLKDMQYPIEWHQYDMDHSVCMQEIRDISTWMKKRLNWPSDQ
jgi:phospholipase/carboxylesterase